MSYTLVAEKPDVFKAAASVIGTVMDQDADEPSDERGVADGAFSNGGSPGATRFSQTF
jgi:poly(3-hydroxybutyrate) depolymerase